MSDDCIFCGSDNTYEAYEGVIRCKDCWRIEVRAGNAVEQYEGAHWLDGNVCIEHDFVDTGTKRSWCKHCNTDATFIFERGEYVANDDIELFQRYAKILSEGNT